MQVDIIRVLSCYSIKYSKQQRGMNSLRRIGLLLVSFVLLTSTISCLSLIIPHLTADTISAKNKQVSSDYYWTFLFGPGSGSDAFNSIVACQDGGFIATGEVTIDGLRSISLVRISGDGRILWHQFFQLFDYQAGMEVIECETGGFAIIAEVDEINRNALLIRTDDLGNLSWYQEYGIETYVETGQAIIECSSGGFAIAGTKGYDFWLIRTNTVGTPLWEMTYGGIRNDYCYSLQETNDGGFVLAGQYQNETEFNTNAWILRTNSIGGSIWNVTYGNGGFEACYDIIQGSTGNYVVVGETETFSTDGFAASYLDNGTLLWNTTFGTSTANYAYAVTECNDGSYAVTGRTEESGVSGSDENLWLVRLSSGGSHLWNKSYGGSLSDEGRAILQTSNGDFIIAGKGEGIHLGSYAWCFQVPDDALSKWSFRFPSPPNFFLIGLGSGLACLVLFGTFLIFHRSKTEISIPLSKPSKQIIRKSYNSPRLPGEITLILKGKNKCSQCGERSPRTEVRCPHCKSYLHRCFFCDKPIQENDPILFCPSCEALAHQDHMEDWLAKRQYCPRCKFRFKKDSSTSRL